MKLTPEEMRQHLIRVTLKPISFSPSYDKRSAKPVNPNIKQTLNPILLGSNVKFFFRIGGKSACMQKFTKFFIWHQILIKTGKMSSYHFYHSVYSTYSINSIISHPDLNKVYPFTLNSTIAIINTTKTTAEEMTQTHSEHEIFQY